MIVPESKVNTRTKTHVPKGDLNAGGYVAMMTTRGLWQPGWAPSQADLFAEDWERAEK
jgi:hypothetical protein